MLSLLYSSKVMRPEIQSLTLFLEASCFYDVISGVAVQAKVTLVIFSHPNYRSKQSSVSTSRESKTE